VEKIAAEEHEFAADAEISVFMELQIAKDIEMEKEERRGVVARVRDAAFGEGVRQIEKTVGDALHGGDDDGDAGKLGGGANESRGVEHAPGTEEGGAAKFEGDNFFAR
jgi:hypothetical protein